MKNTLLLIISLFVSTSTVTSFAESTQELHDNAETNIIEELDPTSPNIEEQLQILDQIYEEETGMPAHIDRGLLELNSLFDTNYFQASTCYRDTCAVYLAISKAEQKARLFVNGNLHSEFLVSTGTGRGTPNFDRHPNGRIYNRYTSTRYPGGDYAGLGNMPYAVFIEGGYAVHGTPKSNWSRLGTRASHGCVRVHPDNGYIFNQLVRTYGVRNTWITIY